MSNARTIADLAAVTSTTGGDVGIGATSPDSLLHVGTGTNTDGTDVTITIGGDSANSRQSLITKKIQSDDRALQIHASAGSSDDDIRFFSDSSTERMRIDSSGNVIVGATSAGNAKVTSVNGVAFEARDGTQPYYQWYNSGAGTDLKYWRCGPNTSGDLQWQTVNDAYSAATVRMIIDSSGNLGIGTSGSLSNKLSVNGNQVLLANGELKFADAGNSLVSTIKNQGASGTSMLAFLTGSTPTERMRITQNGELAVGGTTNTSAATIYSESSSVALAAYRKSSTSTVAVATFRSDSGGTDSVIARIDVDGDLKNATGSYGSISDARMKNSITDANSQWDDIKSLRVRNYKMNGRDQVHLGVVAQELIEDGMSGLVKHDPEEDQYSVKYSILYMKAVKALQEAMTRIETLENKVTALEGA